MRTNGGMLL